MTRNPLAYNLRFDPNRLRRTVLSMAYSGGTVHIGCAFSIIEIVAVLYRDFLRYPNNDPDDPWRAYLVLSKGHGVMAQYACLPEHGFLSDQQIANYFADGSELKGLSDSRVSGLEVTSRFARAWAVCGRGTCHRGKAEGNRPESLCHHRRR